MNITKTITKLRAFAAGVLPAAAMLALLAVPSQAGIILSISPLTTTGPIGSTGNYFDVLLTTDTATTFDIASFSFGLVSASTDVTFTGVLTTVPNYVFNGNSLFGPDIRTTPDGQTVVASDLTSDGLDVTLAGNSTYGLGRVFFDVSPLAVSNLVAITFDGPSTSLANALAAGVAIDTMTGGNVDIVTPEPGTMALFLLSLPAVALLRKRK